MKSLIILFLALACVSGQFFNPFRAFGRRPRPPPPRPAPFNPRPAAAPASSGGSSPSCTNGFHVSSSRSFSWSAARNYCTSRGLKPSSLENAQKVWKIYIHLILHLLLYWFAALLYNRAQKMKKSCNIEKQFFFKSSNQCFWDFFLHRRSLSSVSLQKIALFHRFLSIILSMCWLVPW